MVESETNHAIEVIKQGNLTEGAKILSVVISKNPENELAWLWMSACVGDQEKKIYCLQKVIQLNPSNQSARKGLITFGVEVPPEEPQPVEEAAFSYRDLTAALGGHTQPRPDMAETAPVEVQAGEVDTSSQPEQPVQAFETQSFHPVEPVLAADQSKSSADRAMMLEDFGYSAPEAEPSMEPQVLQSVDKQPRAARRRGGKNNVLLLIILILLIILLVSLLAAKFVFKIF
jgi:hypothetical protein